MQYNVKFKEAVVSMFKNKKTRTVIIASAAAVALAALIIVIVLLISPPKFYLDGDYMLTVTSSDDMTSTYSFDGDMLTNTYWDGESETKIVYEYYITKGLGGGKIVMTNALTGKVQTFDYSEVTEGGELIAVIINSVWYYKK